MTDFRKVFAARASGLIARAERGEDVDLADLSGGIYGVLGWNAPDHGSALLTTYDCDGLWLDEFVPVLSKTHVMFEDEADALPHMIQFPVQMVLTRGEQHDIIALTMLLEAENREQYSRRLDARGNAALSWDLNPGETFSLAFAKLVGTADLFRRGILAGERPSQIMMKLCEASYGARDFIFMLMHMGLDFQNSLITWEGFCSGEPDALNDVDVTVWMLAS